MNKNNYELADNLTLYLSEIDKYNPLTNEQEKSLCKRIQKGDEEALNTLVKHNLKFVVKIAKSYRDRGVPFMDLISEGNLGLIRAAEKFDSDKNVRFISYAVWWVKNSLNECLEKYSVNVENPAPNHVFVNLTDVKHQSEMINTEFEEKLIDIQSRKDSIEELMKCLHEREKKILTLFYGLNGDKEMTLEEVGSEMHLTMERVRQIKDGALIKLKCSALSMDSIEIENMKSLI